MVIYKKKTSDGEVFQCVKALGEVSQCVKALATKPDSGVQSPEPTWQK